MKLLVTGSSGLVGSEAVSFFKEKGWDVWASEFKITGYVIEIYDEETYNRDKNLKSLGI
jgi:nucleoside-diphosphate-sugar epimerase